MSSQIYKKGSFSERLWASLIDQGVLFVAAVILALVYQRMGSHIIFDILAWALPVVYGIFFLRKDGQTPGKKYLHLKVTTADYKSAPFTAILLRESIGKLISGIFLNLGYLWALIDTKRRTWHDRIAKTFVVKTDSAGNLIPIAKEEEITTKQKIFFGLGFLLIGLPIPLMTVVILLMIFVVQPVKIVGNSMTPQYKSGQYYLVNKLEYQFQKPERGEVVIFENPSNKTQYIQRIIALPGERVKIEEGSVYVNDVILDEKPYIATDIYTYEDSFIKEGTEQTVPPNTYFMLGDNRERSIDSRMWGFVPRNNIIGKVSFCYYLCK